MSSSAPLRSSTPAHRVGPGRPNRVEAKRREAALLETATTLILRHGYRALSLESIAREAHVAARTIYAKFGGKAGLLAAVVEHGNDLLERAPDLAHDRRPATAALTEFARAYLWAATRPAALALRRTIIAEAPSFPAVARSFFERGPARVHAQLTEYFRRADVRRELGTRLPATTLAAACQSAMLCGEYRRLVFGLRSSPTRREITAWASNAIALFLDGARAARSIVSQ
ncbi:MAG: TetR/AcrR family transcriptional regulator [Gemmatimonadota bacterium]